MVEQLWKSSEIKNTHAASVYNDGHIFGYNGNFLTAINATTGEKVWQSRPPGAGLLIAVDGHLLILTRSGKLQVAKASPDKYQEVATLDLFEGTTWTPPSFANGRIFARSLSEIAVVELVAKERN